MKFSVSKSKIESGGFEEKEIRDLFEDGDIEGIVARFLTVKTEQRDNEEMLHLVRGGDSGPYPKCKKCHRWMVWVKQKLYWVCPDCLYDQAKPK